MPGLMEQGDYVVNTKKRYDCFVATDLDFMLRRHGINTLLITGINTSSCVLATAIRANVLDYAPIIIEDCVDTMDGPPLHDADGVLLNLELLLHARRSHQIGRASCRERV